MDHYPEYFREEESIDIKKYLFQILYHWWWFAISIFIAFTIAYLVNRYSEKIYQTSCSIVIGEEASKAGSAESILEELSRVRRVKKSVVENEITILKSYLMARKALEELNFGVTYTAVGRRGIAESKMYHNCPFIVIPDTSSNNIYNYPVNVTILSKDSYLLNINDNFDINQKMAFGQPFIHDAFNFTIFLRDNAFTDEDIEGKKYYFVMNNLNSLANHYRGALSVDVNSERGSILNLSMTGHVQEQITDYLNKLSEIYIKSNLDEKNAVSDNTIKFIDDQLRGIVDSLESAGIKLQDFRSANKVIDISKEGSFLFQQMEQLQSEKVSMDVSIRYYNYLLDYIKNKKDYSDVVAPSIIGIQDQLLNTLVGQLNQLNMERRNISISAQENTPQMALVNSQIDNTKKTLLENLSSLINANEIASNNLDNRLQRIEKEVQKLPYTERQLINIQRNFNINDQIYTFLLEKRAEAGITKASNTPDHKILDIARPENTRAIKPKSSMNYMMALVIGGLLPLILIILIEYFNNKIVDKKDIEKSTDVPILGSIGHSDNDSDLPVLNNPKSSLSESFRSLRANLQYMLKEKGQNVICVSSTVSGEGKTFCASNLAVILALAGKKTLLVSLDLRRPKIHRVFKLKNALGLSTYLVNKNNENEILNPTGIDNLFISTAGPIPPNPAELIGSDKMMKYIETVKKEYDYIVIDTPPVALVTDALLLKRVVDIYLFVIRHNYSTKQVLQLVDDLYHKREIKNLCLVVNDVQAKGYYGSRYGYGYGYGYEYYEKGYYEEDEKKETLNSKVENMVRRFLKY